jgi:hypothetical protein
MRRHHIGDYFGVTLETVSRAINAFEREKIILFVGTPRKRRLVIRNRRRLQQLASDSSDFDYWSVSEKAKSYDHADGTDLTIKPGKTASAIDRLTPGKP